MITALPTYQLPAVEECKVVREPFRGRPGFGVVTRLYVKATEETLGSWMGALSRKDAYAQLMRKEPKPR